MGQQVSTFSRGSSKRSHDMMETSISKRLRLSLEPTSFYSDIVAKLHQAEVTTESSSCKPHQRLGKRIVVQGEPSHCWTVHTPTSSFRVECKEIRESEEALYQELERKKLEVAKFLSWFTIAVPGEQATFNDHLDHIGVEIPHIVEISPEEEEDPKEEEDPEEEEEVPEEFPADV
ncbi:hypothetical protein FNV43_RR24551 [Rhamnella rubrinervis]|uniref:Uncharacterized protein n=1 Tax=Rhamnella rubrinervis TaxID=2594499 RepID=A0A8K0GP80_9ROSA|nr:hypothetical protein FNV43_RR24551 [Rhamnella rubrinervis]